MEALQQNLSALYQLAFLIASVAYLMAFAQTLTPLKDGERLVRTDLQRGYLRGMFSTLGLILMALTAMALE